MLINACRIIVPCGATILYCKTILSTELQGPSFTSERNGAMAHVATGTILSAFAIYSYSYSFLILPVFYAVLHALFQRLSCSPCMFYSALSFKVCSRSTLTLNLESYPILFRAHLRCWTAKRRNECTLVVQ